VIVLIRAVDRLPSGGPGHRRRGFGRSAQADAAADGDAQPLQERLERALKQNPSEFTPFLVMNPRDRRSPLTVPIALGGVECFAKNRISHIMKLTTAHNVRGKITTAHNVLGNRLASKVNSKLIGAFVSRVYSRDPRGYGGGAACGLRWGGRTLDLGPARRGAPRAEGFNGRSGAGCPDRLRGGQRIKRVPACHCATRVSLKARPRPASCGGCFGLGMWCAAGLSVADAG